MNRIIEERCPVQQVSDQRAIPVDLDPTAIIDLWASYYQLQVVEQSAVNHPVRHRGRRVKLWTISVAGYPAAANNFWSALDDWLEAYDVF